MFCQYRTHKIVYIKHTYKLTRNTSNGYGVWFSGETHHNRDLVAVYLSPVCINNLIDVEVCNELKKKGV